MKIQYKCPKCGCTHINQIVTGLVSLNAQGKFDPSEIAWTDEMHDHDALLCVDCEHTGERWEFKTA